jgi:hypothetical protein
MICPLCSHDPCASGFVLCKKRTSHNSKTGSRVAGHPVHRFPQAWPFGSLLREKTLSRFFWASFLLLHPEKHNIFPDQCHVMVERLLVPSFEFHSPSPRYSTACCRVSTKIPSLERSRLRGTDAEGIRRNQIRTEIQKDRP